MEKAGQRSGAGGVVGEAYFRLIKELKFSWKKIDFNFKRPARTSRDTMDVRTSWFIMLHDTRDGRTAIGECAPINGLSIDAYDQMDTALNTLCAGVSNPSELNQILTDFPSISFGLEMAIADYTGNSERKLFGNYPYHISINGLVWMNDKATMLQEALEKIMQGFHVIKFKVGSLNFEEELDILEKIRMKFSPEEIEIRLDANGAFQADNVFERLEQLERFQIHSIEQPIKPGQHKLMAEICSSGIIDIALDEELIGIRTLEEREVLIEEIRPHYLILKPTLLGGFYLCEEYISLINKYGGNWWVTSALESNLGLNAIAQWVNQFSPELPQGLGTGTLYTNNFVSPVNISNGYLQIASGDGWDLSRLFDANS